MNVLNCGLFESEGPGWPKKQKKMSPPLLQESSGMECAEASHCGAVPVGVTVN